MRILLACEESQAVTKELRKLGHEAYSCDILESSGGHPEWHLQQDVTELLKQKWDMIIAFPPCTHLATSGTRHFEKKRLDGRQKEAIEFFMLFEDLDCPKVAIENPVNIIGGELNTFDIAFLLNPNSVNLLGESSFKLYKSKLVNYHQIDHKL